MCPQASTSSQPAGSPRPRISPRSLMLSGSLSCSFELGGITAFKSTIEPLSHTTARVRVKSQDIDCPTICPFKLIANATLKQSPGSFPRSVILPFLHRVARNRSSPEVKAPPTTSPASLSQIGNEKLPPKVPKSVRAPWSHKNACCSQKSGQPT